MGIHAGVVASSATTFTSETRERAITHNSQLDFVISTSLGKILINSIPEIFFSCYCVPPERKFVSKEEIFFLPQRELRCGSDDVYENSIESVLFVRKRELFPSNLYLSMCITFYMLITKINLWLIYIGMYYRSNKNIIHSYITCVINFLLLKSFYFAYLLWWIIKIVILTLNRFDIIPKSLFFLSCHLSGCHFKHLHKYLRFYFFTDAATNIWIKFVSVASSIAS